MLIMWPANQAYKSRIVTTVTHPIHSSTDIIEIGESTTEGLAEYLAIRLFYVE